MALWIAVKVRIEMLIDRRADDHDDESGIRKDALRGGVGFERAAFEDALEHLLAPSSAKGMIALADRFDDLVVDVVDDGFEPGIGEGEGEGEPDVPAAGPT
jgi:hypothetical protein